MDACNAEMQPCTEIMHRPPEFMHLSTESIQARKAAVHESTRRVEYIRFMLIQSTEFARSSTAGLVEPGSILIGP